MKLLSLVGLNSLYFAHLFCILRSRVNTNKQKCSHTQLTSCQIAGSYTFAEYDRTNTNAFTLTYMYIANWSNIRTTCNSLDTFTFWVTIVAVQHNIYLLVCMRYTRKGEWRKKKRLKYSFDVFDIKKTDWIGILVVLSRLP